MGSRHDKRIGLPASRYVRSRLGARMHLCVLLRKDTRDDPTIRNPSALDFGS